jgi:tetratricopeptide (TPR) repeat protein
VTKTTLDTAKRLLKRSREVEWAFPTSFSNTILVRSADSAWLQGLSAERHGVAEAAGLLLRNGDEAAALELVANTWRAWLPVRDLDGGRAFLASILEAGSGRPYPWRAHALYGDSVFAIKLGDLDASRASAQAALTTGAEVGDAEGQLLGLLGLSRVAFEEGNHERAESLAEEARELGREVKASMSQAPQHMLAQSVRASGDLDRAARLFEESLMLNRQIEDEGMISVELFNLGHVEARRGNIDAAEHLFVEAAERIDPSDRDDEVQPRGHRIRQR